MRFWLICLALLFAGCATPPVTVQPTLRGPIVPTRDIPTATDTLSASATPSPTLTFTATDAPPTATNTATSPPSDTPAATIEVAVVPSATNSPTLTPTTVPSATPSPVPSPTDTVETPSPTVTNTIETPSPTVTNTVETPTPTATNTIETPSATPTDTPAPPNTPSPTVTPISEPVLYPFSSSLQPVMVQGEITLDTPVSGAIDNDHPAVVFTFQGTAGMSLDALLTMQTGDLDSFLLLLDPKGREIARNDDIDDEQRDSAIHEVTLTESGAYAFVATRYGQQFGETTGDFELMVSESTRDQFGTFSIPIGYESSINATLDDETPERLYTFRATEGDVITIQMTTTDGDLDPNITLTDNIGTILAYNDDNLLLDVLDSLIQGYIIPRSGYYTLIAGRYNSSENSGDYRLKIARSGQNTSSRFAVLNNINSGFVSEEVSFSPINIVGDIVDDEDEREHTYQGLLTFHLPPADAPIIENATFAISPCVERGGGWDTLGAMTIYEDNYGDIDTMRNITRPLQGARILSTQTECSPIDLTEIVQNAYETGDLDIQLRLMFRNHTNNGETDYVIITPSLLVSFAE